MSSDALKDTPVLEVTNLATDVVCSCMVNPAMGECDPKLALCLVCTAYSVLFDESSAASQIPSLQIVRKLLRNRLNDMHSRAN